jgi:NADH-quinone oxidoreductase subunit J
VQYLPIGAVVGLVLLAELVLVAGFWVAGPALTAVAAAPTPALAQLSNTQALGALIYTRYVYAFQASGVVLLIAMIGAIVLTLRSREGVRRQRISQQIDRVRTETVEIVHVKIGEGV